ncbi:Uncharacterised protein [Mycobacteroides abscessus subsp. abscessus]|nr:Uncharacterised protein [Mycobacteroides abscessus subsp. abscessus]SKX40812.1 Uncharacterised protein [Mycobacteroides abscessus subsp. abscessus]
MHMHQNMQQCADQHGTAERCTIRAVGACIGAVNALELQPISCSTCHHAVTRCEA